MLTIMGYKNGRKDGSIPKLMAVPEIRSMVSWKIGATLNLYIMEV
jgi:hypothetical protein